MGPTTTLDSTAYPHLLDLIIAFSPPSSLAVLRETSRTLCPRIDTLSSHHVLLKPASPPFFDIHTPTTPSGRVPAFMKWTHYADPKKNKTCRPNGRKAGSLLTAQQLLDAVHVLDIDATHPMCAFEPTRTFPNLETVRLRNMHSSAQLLGNIHPRQLVLFESDKPEHVPVPARTGWGVNRRCTKLVINKTSNPKLQWDCFGSTGQWGFSERKLADVVWIFPFNPHARPPAAPPSADSGGAYELPLEISEVRAKFDNVIVYDVAVRDIVDCLLEWVRSRQRLGSDCAEMRITLVDTNYLFQEAILESLRVRFESDSESNTLGKFESVEALAAHAITYLTLSEYRKSVGEEEFALETVIDL